MDEPEDAIRERAYFLWQAQGCPPGRADEFWYRASDAQRGARPQTEAEIDETVEESFPASDPPASNVFT